MRHLICDEIDQVFTLTQYMVLNYLVSGQTMASLVARQEPLPSVSHRLSLGLQLLRQGLACRQFQIPEYMLRI